MGARFNKRFRSSLVTPFYYSANYPTDSTYVRVSSLNIAEKRVENSMLSSSFKELLCSTVVCLSPLASPHASPLDPKSCSLMQVPRTGETANAFFKGFMPEAAPFVNTIAADR